MGYGATQERPTYTRPGKIKEGSADKASSQLSLKG